MSLSEFPPLPKPSHARKRSASDPACFTSSTDSDTTKEIKALEKKLAALKDIEQAKGEVAGSKGIRKDSGIGIGISDGVVGEQSGNQSSSATSPAIVKPVSNAVSEKTAVKGVAKTSAHGTAQKAAHTSKTPASKANAAKYVSQLSSAELKALSDPSVLHLKLATIDPRLPSSQQTPEIIYTSYPLPLLCAISPRIATVLASRTTPESSRKPSTTSTNSTDTTLIASSGTTVNTPSTPTGLILHTSSPTPLSLILAYALSSSRHGSLTHPTPHTLLSIPLTDCAFFKYGRIVEEARYLGFTYLEKTITKRKKNIAGGQVHSNDVERMLANDAAIATPYPVTVNTTNAGTSAPISMRQMAVTSIATALWEGRLQYKHKYDALRQQYPEFDSEIWEALEALDVQYGY